MTTISLKAVIDIPGLFAFLQNLLLVTALSTDAFVASLAYGAKRIRIPFSSAVLLTLICTGTLLLSLFAGSLLRPLLSADRARAFRFAMLFILGLVKLCDSTIKAYIRGRTLHKKITFSALNLSFILDIYANPEAADRDASKILSHGEAASLAIALSLDGLAVGVGAALATINLPEILALSLITGMAAVLSGCALGNKLAKHCSLDLSWLSGALLMLLALCSCLGNGN